PPEKWGWTPPDSRIICLLGAHTDHPQPELCHRRAPRRPPEGRTETPMARQETEEVRTTSEKWYALSAEEILQRLGTDTEHGLSEADAQARQTEYGKNQLPAGETTSPWQILIAQFTSVMVIVLIVAAIISFAIGDATDAIVILAIVVLNAALGFFQEYQ